MKDRSEVVSSKNNYNNIKKEHGLVITFFLTALSLQNHNKNIIYLDKQLQETIFNNDANNFLTFFKDIVSCL